MGDQKGADGAASAEQKINDVTQLSLEATERIVQLTDEARDVGRQTTEVLMQQGEQLNGIRRKTEDIEEDLNETEDQISKLECFTCGLFRRSRSRRRRDRKRMTPRLEFKEGSATPESSGKPTPQPARRAHAAEDEKRSNDDRERKAPGGEVLEGGIITRITNDEKEEVIDANLGDTSKMVAELGKIAEQQGAELTVMIDDITEQVEQENKQIEKFTERLEKKID